VAQVRMQGDARRDQIAQAVLALTARHGVGALSVASVAQHVGVAPSALYRHYPNKEAMLAGTLDRLATRVFDNLARARAESPGPLAAMERLLELQAELIRTHQGLPFVLFSEGLHRSPDHRRRLTSFMARFRRRLEALVREAQAAGEVRPELEPAAVAVHFIGLYVPPALLWNLTGGRFDIAAQTRQAWAVFHAGVRTRAGSRPRAPRRARIARTQESA
jgi:TetR/AcrR family transcriptional regulator, fatty acid metabolism regulator protein